MTEEHDQRNRLVEANRLVEEYERMAPKPAVQSFIRQHESLRDLLEPLLDKANQLDGATLKSPEINAEAELPTHIGPYRILEEIGQGGMGTVLLAEQEAPVRRRVALKVIKLGMDTKQVIARFEAERQALAVMNHPHIARVIGSGATERGRSYFVMEYVPGVQITDYCDSHRLSTHDRLTLILKVCNAVQHAHHKGIIHRDIKPSNILVYFEDGNHIPKIIDFGVAKATGYQLTEKTVFTNIDQFIGTPIYASPEQTGAMGMDVDTRTDVYSLGVVLYELLVGRLPFDPEQMRRRGYKQFWRERSGQQPPRPSALLAGLGETSTTVAKMRRVDARNLSRQLRGDLDWITMRAIEGEPSRRYATVSGLALDIERHLNGEPVSAGPPSAAYRIKKLVLKHKGVVAAISVLLVTIVTGAAAITGLYLKAMKGERQAREAEERFERMFEQNLYLADLNRLNHYRKEADTLWPARLERAEDMRTWLARTADLVGRLGEHQRTATLLQEGRIVWEEPPETREEKIDGMRRLVDGLTEFSHPSTGTTQRIRKRLDFAETVRTRSIVEPRAAWDAAIRSIVDECSDYSEMATLRAQHGLVPLRRDPESGLWEFWHIQTGERPEIDEPTDRYVLTPETGIIFVLLPGGTFRMGSSRTLPNEHPVSDVLLDPFFISKYEMTQGQWLRFVGQNPSYYGPDYQTAVKAVHHFGRRVPLLHPVELVSWDTALAVLERMELELPTEAQWEYAARGGTESLWWTGERPESLTGAVNLADEYCRRNQGPPGWKYEEWLNDGSVVHAPIGMYRANPFGLHDILGNVWEWCRDWYLPYAGSRVRPGDGLRLVPDGRDHPTTRVFRGGAFGTTANQARSGYRSRAQPVQSLNSVGVRPVRKVER